jgi:hypothetical protein
MAQFRATKIYCGRKCQQRAYRIRNGLPLTWKPDPTKRKVIGDSLPVLPKDWSKGSNGNQFDCQVLQTAHGVRKIYVNKITSEVIVFGIKDGKEILIK